MHQRRQAEDRRAGGVLLGTARRASRARRRVPSTLVRGAGGGMDRRYRRGVPMSTFSPYRALAAIAHGEAKDVADLSKYVTRLANGVTHTRRRQPLQIPEQDRQDVSQDVLLKLLDQAASILERMGARHPELLDIPEHRSD